MKNLIDTTVSHYRILEQLGKGGMGVVYKAEDTRLKRLVALKFLTPNLTLDREANQQFIYEAQTASTLDHQHICTIHEIDESDDGRIFIAMSYYKGETLRDKISRGPLPVNEAIRIAVQIAGGLSKAHKKGISHRDIKPGNIMITEEGILKIIDFGLSKLISEHNITKPGTTPGTVTYMSPEQIHGKQIDHRTDIWSLGVVLYQMLTGDRPFTGEIDQAVIYSILNESPEPMNLQTDIAETLERIVNKALAKDPSDRYQDMNEMLAELLTLKQITDTSGEIQILQRNRKKSGKKVSRIILIPVVLFLLVAIGFFLLKTIIFESSSFPDSKAIAIISFENQTGDENFDYLQKAIPNLLITSLEQSSDLHVTTWERLYDLIRQTGRENIEIIDGEMGFEICSMDGIEAIIVGSFTKAGNVFATDAKVLNVNSKELVTSVSSRGDGIASILTRQIDEMSEKISLGMGVSNQIITETQRPIVEVTTSSMDAYNYFVRGREEWEKKYMEDARKFLEKAVELDTTFAIAYFYLSRVYRTLGNIPARNEAINKAQRLAQYATEKEQLWIEGNYAAYIEMNNAKRVRIFQEIIRKFPKEKRAYLWLGVGYNRDNDPDRAIEMVNKALQLDPNYGYAVNQLGYAHSKKGEYEKAIEYFKRYATIYPGEADPFDSMGEVYLRMGKLEESLAKYREASEVRPDYIWPYRSMAYIYALQENYSQVQEIVDKWITFASSPHHIALGHTWKGFYYFWLGNPKQSIIEINKAQKIWKERDYMWGLAIVDWLKGWIHLSLNEFSEGRESVKNVMKILKENQYSDFSFDAEFSHYYFGLADVRQGRIDSAIVCYTLLESSLPELRPFNKNILTTNLASLRAEILLARDSVDSAIKIVQKIQPFFTSNIHPNTIELYNIQSPSTRDILARAYYQKGELDKAISIYEQLTTFNPSSKERRLVYPKYHYKLGQLYEEKGFTDKAIEQYQIFLEIWKDADENSLELVDAKERLAKLN